MKPWTLRPATETTGTLAVCVYCWVYDNFVDFVFVTVSVNTFLNDWSMQHAVTLTLTSNSRLWLSVLPVGFCKGKAKGVHSHTQPGET